MFIVLLVSISLYIKVGIGVVVLIIYLVRQFQNSRVVSAANKFNPDDLEAVAADLDFPVSKVNFKSNDVLKILNQIDYEMELDYITIKSFKKFEPNKYLAITLSKMENEDAKFDYTADYKRINFLLEYIPETNSIKYYSYSYQNIDDSYVMKDFAYKFSQYIESFEF